MCDPIGTVNGRLIPSLARRKTAMRRCMICAISTRQEHMTQGCEYCSALKEGVWWWTIKPPGFRKDSGMCAATALEYQKEKERKAHEIEERINFEFWSSWGCSDFASTLSWDEIMTSYPTSEKRSESRLQSAYLTDKKDKQDFPTPGYPILQISLQPHAIPGQKQIYPYKKLTIIIDPPDVTSHFPQQGQVTEDKQSSVERELQNSQLLIEEMHIREEFKRQKRKFLVKETATNIKDPTGCHHVQLPRKFQLNPGLLCVVEKGSKFRHTNSANPNKLHSSENDYSKALEITSFIERFNKFKLMKKERSER